MPLFILRNRLNALLRGLLVFIPFLWVLRTTMVYAGVPDAYIYTSFETRVDAILVGAFPAIALYCRASSRLIAKVRRARYMPVVLAGLRTRGKRTL